MKIILLQLLSILCLSTQKETKGVEDVKNFIDKCGWFKQKEPVIIKVTERNNIYNIGTKDKDSKDAPKSLTVTENGGKDGISTSSSPAPVAETENVISLQDIVEQLNNFETGITQPLSKSADIVEGVSSDVKGAPNVLPQSDQAPVSEILDSADKIIKQPLMMSEDIIKKSSVTGKDSSPPDQKSLSLVNSGSSPLTAILEPPKQVVTNPKELSSVIQTQTVPVPVPPILLKNPSSAAVAPQLQFPPSTIIPTDIKPKLQSNTATVVNQAQPPTNFNNQLSNQAFKPQFNGFMFGDIFNIIPNIVIPQIQQALPQFVPPVIYSQLPKFLTPILPPIVSNILFPSDSNPQVLKSN
ncbi:uncharacterized protein LOC111053159 [Nilaparvata lugens]|uniref:uncharacterized protein LOC111053159 n=1 Tax=Nilaparvata lugens TaxID=108931 RepID=UPI000B983099|nr:uncharacterized protein LOC111053159 [Nilaparvata lugens]